jgi:hypothetical protein
LQTASLNRTDPALESTALPPKSYDEIETKITAYIQALTMEPDPQLQAVTASKLRRFVLIFNVSLF